MKTFLRLMMALGMLAPPALWAEAAPMAPPTAPLKAVPSAVASPEPTAVATAEPTVQPTVEPTPAATPEIPATKSDTKSEAAPVLPADVSPTAGTSNDVEIPKEAPEVEKPESVRITPEKPGRFRWGNLFLGALGGGILAGSAGFLLFTGSKKDGSIDYDSARVVVPVSALIGIVAGGGLSVLLGLTTPLPVAPPSMNSNAGRDGLAWEPIQNGQRLVLTTHF